MRNWKQPTQTPISDAPTFIAGAMRRQQALYPALEQVTKPNLTTAEASYFLDRAPQTLRTWAMKNGTGPISPRRIGGLLAWSTSEVKALAGVPA